MEHEQYNTEAFKGHYLFYFLPSEPINVSLYMWEV